MKKTAEIVEQRFYYNGETLNGNRIEVVLDMHVTKWREMLRILEEGKWYFDERIIS